eukprot:6466595-Amphidinium_carterae.1
MSHSTCTPPRSYSGLCREAHCLHANCWRMITNELNLVSGRLLRHVVSRQGVMGVRQHAASLSSDGKSGSVGLSSLAAHVRRTRARALLSTPQQPESTVCLLCVPAAATGLGARWRGIVLGTERVQWPLFASALSQQAAQIPA